MLRYRFLVPLPSALLVASACGGDPAGAVSKATLPETQTAADVIDDPKCSDESLEKGSNPLIIDWPATQRGDLEVVMKESVAIVDYSCDGGVKLLADCSAAGDYGFVGVSVKSSTISLESADEIAANLSGGAVIPASFKAELQRGNSLQLAFMLVGKQSAARPFLSRAELVGRCDGATHFVRRADVGAFAMTSGARSSVSAAADIFGQAASAGSSTQKDVAKTDGKPAACKSADPDAENPPRDCQALIRVTLLPIDDKPVAEAAKAVEKVIKGGGDVQAGCPGDFVLIEGKCQKPATGEEPVAYLCDYDKPAECQTQCERGDYGSCSLYAMRYMWADEGPELTKDLHDSFKAACDQAQAGPACYLAGMQIGDPAKALPFFVKGCGAGSTLACDRARGELLEGTNKDPQRYFDALAHGCSGGSPGACGILARHYAAGDQVTQDLTRAMKLAARGCNGGSALGCELLAARELSEAACEAAGLSDHLDPQTGCSSVAAGKSLEQGVKHLIRGCDLDKYSCLKAKALQDKCGDLGLCDAFGGRIIVLDPETQMG